MSLTNDQMDDLVEEWHEGEHVKMGFVEFLMSRTDLTYEQVLDWIRTAKLPEEK